MLVTYKRKIPIKLGNSLKAVVTISIPYNEELFAESNQHGEAFLKVMQLIAEDERVSEVTILIADTLQAHNLKAIYSLSEEEAELKAKELGAYWFNENIAANAPFFKNFGKPITVEYWDKYKKNPNFKETLKKTVELYISEKPNGFYQKTRSLAGTFTNKTLKRIEQSDMQFQCTREDIIESSVALLHEESAIRAILGGIFAIEYYPDELDAVMGTICEKYSDNMPYRLALNIRKSQESSYPMTTKLNQKSALFYNRGYSYPQYTSTGCLSAMDEIKIHPLFNAVISSTMLAIDVNDDPSVHVIFLSKYNEFLQGFMLEKHKLVGERKSIRQNIFTVPSSIPTPLSSDDLLTLDEGAEERAGVNNGEKKNQGRGSKLQFSSQ